MLQAPELVKIGETVYKCEGFTIEIQEWFTKYMQYHEHSLIKDSKELLGDDYHDMLFKHLQDVKNGALNFGGERFRYFLKSDEHVAHLFWLCLNKQQPVEIITVLKFVQENVDAAVELFDRLWETAKKK